MHDKSSKDLHSILNPYLFVLKEGKDIQDNYMDFSLIMLKISPPEVLNSPGVKRYKLVPPRREVINWHPIEDSTSSTSDIPF